MAKKAAKRNLKAKKGKPFLTYEVKGQVDLELEYLDGDLNLLSILSHDVDEMELLDEGGKYACLDAGVGVTATEWILFGRTGYHGSGKPIQIIVPKELINSMRIDNLD